jgi:hypothetical protein
MTVLIDRRVFETSDARAQKAQKRLVALFANGSMNQAQAEKVVQGMRERAVARKREDLEADI